MEGCVGRSEAALDLAIDRVRGGTPASGEKRDGAGREDMYAAS